jgi:ABC-type branched-subunit amino acid transport system ATPase component
MTTSAVGQEILLQIRNLNKNFGGLQAIDDVTMDLPAGVITTLVGPNGAGKTTLFNLITGHLIPSSGSVHWLGKALKGVEPWQVARLGIARTFQDLRLYNQMTVEENIMTVMERGSWLWQAGRKAAEQRVTEIARMLGGEKLSATTLAHAREMLHAMAVNTAAKTKPRAAKT